MNWPWSVAPETVSKAEHDRALALLADADARNIQLLAAYVQLTERVTTPAPAVVLQPFVPPAPTPRSPISQLIREQASESGVLDTPLYIHLQKYARELKRQHKTDDEIMGLLVQWQNTELME